MTASDPKTSPMDEVRVEIAELLQRSLDAARFMADADLNDPETQRVWREDYRRKYLNDSLAVFVRRGLIKERAKELTAEIMEHVQEVHDGREELEMLQKACQHQFSGKQGDLQTCTICGFEVEPEPRAAK